LALTFLAFSDFAQPLQFCEDGGQASDKPALWTADRLLLSSCMAPTEHESADAHSNGRPLTHDDLVRWSVMLLALAIALAFAIKETLLLFRDGVPHRHGS
jgi:hypothetical protein